MREGLTGELREGLEAVAASFDPDELAYLALTSKPESAIRDRLGWALARRGHLVAREWRERCDLAIVDTAGEPLALVEVKASYTHDTRWSMSAAKLHALRMDAGGGTVLETLIRADASKVLRVAGKGKGYLLLISLHRHDLVPVALHGVIAESKRPVRNRTEAEASLKAYLDPLGPVSAPVVLGEGSSFGLAMTVTAWICGPVWPKERWHRPISEP